MADVTIDPRYSKYKNQEIEAILDKVHNADAEPTPESENMISSGAVAAALENLPVTTEEDVRNIVKNYTPPSDSSDSSSSE